MGSESTLKELTGQLLQLTDIANSRFEKIKVSGEEADFFKEVKPFADQVRAITLLWKDKALIWIEKEKPKHIYIQQINTTSENIEMVAIQSFYHNTSRTRFINHVQSINFVLKGIINELK